MGELFWNKIAGAILGTLLVLFGVAEVSHILYHSHAPDEPAYFVDVGDAGGAEEEDAVEAGPPDFGALLRNASVDAGARVANKCVACHVFEKGGGNRTGPALYGIMGNEAGEVAGFSYSNAMAAYDQAWLYQNMYDYLENPRGYLSGTAMNFAGLRKQEERINLIAYMRTLDDNPLPLPEPRSPEPAAPATEAPTAPATVDETGDAVEDAAEAVDQAASGNGEPS